VRLAAWLAVSSSLAAAPAVRAEPAVPGPDGRIPLPDPGPRPPFAASRLDHPLSPGQWSLEILLDARASLVPEETWAPTDVLVGARLGLLERLDLGVAVELRASAAPGATEADVAHAVDVGANYVVFDAGSGLFTLAATLAAWIPAQASGETTVRSPFLPVPMRHPDDAVLIPAVRGLFRFLPWLGLGLTLSLPVTLTDDAREVLGFEIRPHFQPLDWLWVAVGATFALAGNDDFRAPFEVELGFTPWGPIDLFAVLAFPDLDGLGADHRVLLGGLRVRPMEIARGTVDPAENP
jgi:hypothetical protein